MKKILLFILIIVSVFGYSQNNISYLSNEFGNIWFEISPNLIYIQTDSFDEVSNYRINNKGDNFVVLEVNLTEYKEIFEQLQFKYENVEPVLIYENKANQVCFDEIIIKTKNEKDVDEFFRGFDIDVIESKFESNQFVVKIKHTDTYKVFELINILYKDKDIEYIEPNFLFLNAFHTDDEHYSQQWAINNQGYLGGTPDADMDVDEAWNYTTGEGIKVAVLDVGVDLNHPDLQANLLLGYDAINYTTNGGFVGAHSNHGTPCAGIIGAIANNDIGIAGIAYNAKIIPIRIGHMSSMNLNAAVEGINWAWQNGADVLSNSWGGGSPSSSLNTAINNAIVNGRGGKGCIVLFSSGNSNSSSVSYPASLPNVIAVGASSMCDERKSFTSCDGESWGANYGTNLDVVAPGVKIYTTDNTGHTDNNANGYNKNGNYYSSFNGTSAACPNAAGVVALILSTNPNLTGVQARDVLQKTTDKILGYTYNTTKPSGTWNNEVGYGRVNAYKAVKEAMFYHTYINTSNVICGTDFASLENLPINYSSYTISWVSSSNIQITGSSIDTNVNFTVTPNSGQGWIKAILNGDYEITKDVWIGVPAYFNNAVITGESSVCDFQQYTYTIPSHTCIETTNWSVSPNLTIVSSTANSVTVARNPFSTQYAGLISANIPNSTISIAKGVWVGVPTGGFDIQKIGAYDFYVGQWTKLKASYTPIMYEQNEPLNLTFEWQIPYSMVKNFPDTAYKDVKPNFEGQLNIGVRSLCDCGYSNWVYKMFNVIGDGNGGGPIIIPIED